MCVVLCSLRWGNQRSEGGGGWVAYESHIGINEKPDFGVCGCWGWAGWVQRRSMARVQHTGLNLRACPFPEPLPWPREQMRFNLLPPASGSWHTLVLCQDLQIPSHLMIQVPAFVSTGAGCSLHELISKHPGVITRGQRRGNDVIQGLWGKCLGKRPAPAANIPHSPSPAHIEVPSPAPPSWAFPRRILPHGSPPEDPPLAPPSRAFARRSLCSGSLPEALLLGAPPHPLFPQKEQ